MPWCKADTIHKLHARQRAISGPVRGLSREDPVENRDSGGHLSRGIAQW